MVRRKHSAWINYLHTKDVHSYNRYIEARNTESHVIRNARRGSESSLAYECRCNNKAVWNYGNRINLEGRAYNYKKGMTAF